MPYPVWLGFSGLPVLERMHEMACLIAGEDGAFRERPNYILYGMSFADRRGLFSPRAIVRSTCRSMRAERSKTR